MRYIVLLAMFIVKVTRKFQVTIPKEIREKLRLRVGDKLSVQVEGDKIVFRPLIRRVEDPIGNLLSLVKKPLPVDAVRLVEESWDED